MMCTNDNLEVCVDTPDQGQKPAGKFEDAIKNYPSQSNAIKTVVKDWVEATAADHTIDPISLVKPLQRCDAAGISISQSAKDIINATTNRVDVTAGQ